MAVSGGPAFAHGARFTRQEGGRAGKKTEGVGIHRSSESYSRNTPWPARSQAASARDRARSPCSADAPDVYLRVRGYRLIAFHICTASQRFIPDAGRDRESSRRGFTLIELLVVVVIIGILAAIMFPRMLQAIETAKQGRTVSRLTLMRGGLNMYFADHAIAATDELNQFPWNLVQLTGCTLHTPKHVYVTPDGEGGSDLIGEEVGTGVQLGDQITDWCTPDGSHAFCGATTASANDGRTLEAVGSRGGWNYCGGAGVPAQYRPTGTVWIDEDVMMYSGKNANWM
jgi:prepilin-type N-terminal cleavage/methylation domain-containing protein